MESCTALIASRSSGRKVSIELISVIGGNVDIARIRQSTRKRWHLRGTRIRRSRGGNRCQHNQADRHERKSVHTNASGYQMLRGGRSFKSKPYITCGALDTSG